LLIATSDHPDIWRKPQVCSEDASRRSLPAITLIS